MKIIFAVAAMVTVSLAFLGGIFVLAGLVLAYQHLGTTSSDMMGRDPSDTTTTSGFMGEHALMI